MKFHNIFAAVSAIAIMASCSSIGDEAVPAMRLSKTPIVYGSPQSRATGTQFENGDKFAVWTSYTSEDGAITVPYFSNQQVTLVNNVWTADKSYFWPVDGRLDFYAIYPLQNQSSDHDNWVEVSADGPQPVVEYHIHNFAESSDFIAAKTESMYCGEPRIVPLRFQHLLSRLNFGIINQCKYGTDLEINLERVDIEVEMHQHGRLNWDRMSLEAYGDQVPLKHSIGARHMDKNETASLGTFYFIPEDVGVLKVTALWKTLNGGVEAGSYSVSKDIYTSYILSSGKSTNINLVLRCNFDNPNNGDVSVQ